MFQKNWENERDWITRQVCNEKRTDGSTYCPVSDKSTIDSRLLR